MKLTLPARVGLAALDYTGDPCSHELVGTRIAQIWTASVLIGVELVSTQIGGYLRRWHGQWRSLRVIRSQARSAARMSSAGDWVP